MSTFANLTRVKARSREEEKRLSEDTIWILEKFGTLDYPSEEKKGTETDGLDLT